MLINKKLYNKNYCSFRRSLAFTLAEVLITLGIIGIVAAMTIPILITEYQKQVTATRLSKVFSLMSQSLQNSQLEIGTSKSWGKPSTEYDDTASYDWWHEYFIPNAKFSVAKICTSATGNAAECALTDVKNLDGSDDVNTGVGSAFNCGTTGGCYVLNDGTALHFSGVGNQYAYIHVDINGKSKPNTWGKDIFTMMIDYVNGYVAFYGKGTSRATLISNNNLMCNKEAGTKKGRYCGLLIQMDGWQIANDYPW